MATPNTSGAIARITKEIAHIQKCSDLSLAVACRDSDVRHVRALIIGPPETPYEFGFFEFDIKFGKEYPIKSPSVRCITTNAGRCRFNPNIYNCGKVCLSILGTWRGNPGEEWSSAQGLESVLLSIQSLMSQHPYENEPGYEESKKEDAMPKAYISKIRHETIRIAVLKRLEGLLGIEDSNVPAIYRKIRDKTQDLLNKSPPPGDPSSKSLNGNGQDGVSTPNTDTSAYEYDAEATFFALEAANFDPFADLMKRRFLWYYDTYAKTIEHAGKEQQDGEAFQMMEFEGQPNGMNGQFDYKGLEKRLKRVAKALEDERKNWEKEGAEQVQQETQLATQLAFQFKQLKHKWDSSTCSGSRMEINLPKPKNPFVWDLTMFGKPMTNLDGGIFNMTLSIPPNFPDVQPRVKIETPIFHHRVASSGMLCYFPEREDEIGSHLEAIVAAIEDENSTYDPRAAVNPGAFALYWGGEEKRKFYNRKLRRSAQESTLGAQSLRKRRMWRQCVKAYERHRHPPKPFDQMVLKKYNPNGKAENITLSREEALKYYYDRVEEVYNQFRESGRPHPRKKGKEKLDALAVPIFVAFDNDEEKTEVNASMPPHLTTFDKADEEMDDMDSQRSVESLIARLGL